MLCVSYYAFTRDYMTYCYILIYHIFSIFTYVYAYIFVYLFIFFHVVYLPYTTHVPLENARNIEVLVF